MSKFRKFFGNKYSKKWFKLIKKIYAKIFMYPELYRSTFFKILSKNTNLTIDIIKQNPGLWDMRNISENISVSDIMKNLDMMWDFFYISINPSLNISFVLDNLHKNWYWADITKNSGIQMSDIEGNSNLPWGYKYIIENPNLTIKFVNNNIDRWKLSAFISISKNPGIKMSDIKENPDLGWKAKYVSENPNLTFKFIIKHPTWNWNWCAISKHPNIKIKDILENPQKIFHFKKTYLMITNKIIFKWDWKCVSENPNVTAKDVINNIEKDWDLISVAKYGNLKYKDFLKGPFTAAELKYEFLKNKNLRIADISKYEIDNIFLNLFYKNNLEKDKEMYIKHKICKLNALNFFNEFSLQIISNTSLVLTLNSEYLMSKILKF